MANERMNNLNRAGTDPGNTCLNWGSNCDAFVFLDEGMDEGTKGQSSFTLCLCAFATLCLYL